VGDPSGQPAHCFELLGLAQLDFELLLRGYVEGHTPQDRCSTGAWTPRGAHRAAQVNQPPRRSDEPILDGRIPRLGRRRQLLEHCTNPSRVVFVDGVPRALGPDEPVRIQPQEREGSWREIRQEKRVAVHLPRNDLRILDELAIPVQAGVNFCGSIPHQGVQPLGFLAAGRLERRGSPNVLCNAS
jgi:hypothetical protein